MVTSEQITTARKRLGENMDVFAMRFGVNRTTIFRWETKGPPRGAAQIALERVLAELEPAP